MPLTCSCDYDWEPEPGQWCFDSFFLDNKDFEPFQAKRRKRCCSCGDLIEIGALCLRHKCVRYPYTEAEAKITGGDWECWEEPWIPIADKIQCEKCGEIWLNLQNVGFECLLPSENMEDALNDYKHDYAPPKIFTEEERQEKISKMKAVVSMYKKWKSRRFKKR